MNIEQRFSPEELEQISEAVRSAETGMRGEIVPVFTESSDNYKLSLFKASTMTSLLVFAILVILDRWVNDFFIYDPIMYLLIVVFSGLIAASLCFFLPFLKRLFTTRGEMDLRCMQKAEKMFLEEEVFNTDQRTGIMLFISFFEHKAIVMGDKGISNVTPQEEWDLVISGLTTELKKGKTTSGIVKAIKDCGKILSERKGMLEDPMGNELSDQPRLK